MKQNILWLCLCWWSTFALAQNTVSGTILQQNNKSVEGLVVHLLRSPDSALVKSELTDTEGRFVFERIKTGEYRLAIAQMGYEAYKSASFSVDGADITLPAIALRETSVELSGVTVTAKVPFIERKIDRTVVNVDALISNAGTNALEVLEKAPGVAVDMDGDIRLKGKSGVMVFVDDKPTYLSSADLANYLRSLPSGSLDKIEIMPNPPAKYDAAGNAGVINIRLKKTVTKGFSGGVSLSYGQGHYHRTNNSFNFNYRINKVNFFGSAAYSQNNTYQDLTIWRDYFTETGAPLSGFVQQSYIKKQFKSANVKLGLDYYLNAKSTVGFVLNGFDNPSLVTTTNNATVSDALGAPVSLIEAVTPADKRWQNGTANVNYTYKMNDKGRELSANADYIGYTSTLDQTLTNTVFSPAKEYVGQSILDSDLPAEIYIRTLKADYTHPLPGDAKLEAGAKTSWVNTDNTANFFDVLDNVATPNYEFSNRFQYRENINAAYVNYNKSWGRWGVQSGLRFENTNLEGDQLGNVVVADSSFKRTYNSLFPTFFASYNLDSAGIHQLGLSLGRRINRPDYQSLNPFTYPMDRFTIYGGNPFLQPTFSNNVELSHTWNNAITTTLSYSYTKDVISETIEQGSNIFYSRPGNFGKSISYGISVNAVLKPTTWWTIQCYTEVMNNRFESLIYGQVLDTAGFYIYIGPNNQFQINQRWSAELSGNYQSRMPYGQFSLIPVWSARAGVACKILKDKGTVKLNVNDLFYTNQPGGAIHSLANSTARWLSYLDTRVITLSFSYRFSRGESLRARKSGGSETEQSRVGT